MSYGSGAHRICTFAQSYTLNFGHCQIFLFFDILSLQFFQIEMVLVFYSFFIMIYNSFDVKLVEKKKIIKLKQQIECFTYKLKHLENLVEKEEKEFQNIILYYIKLINFY